MVKPRRRGFKHRPLIVIVNGNGVTEGGEVVRNLPLFATTSDPHIWVTMDAAWLYAVMEDAYGTYPWYQRRAIDTRDPELPEGIIGNMSKCRLESFGFDKYKVGGGHINPPSGVRKQARHAIWDVPRMFSDPHIAADKLSNTHHALMTFARDVRDWCQQEDIPLRSTLAGLAGALLRDKRFWPDLRGSVPRATNERVRPYLPGVYHQRLHPTHHRIDAAVALDQRRAYHRAAQEVPTPNPTNLYARGFFNDPDSSPIWANRDSILYTRTMAQPGLVAVRCSVLPGNKKRSRPPALDRLTERVGTLYLWTNEITLCEQEGLHIFGIVAAWTSITPDTGLPKYAAWAESQIDSAPVTRQFWLKPTLHALYGLLGARPRVVMNGMKHGKGQRQVWGLNGHPMPVVVTEFTGQPQTVNVPMLGTLQAEIRARSLSMANDLRDHGAEVYHIHADGLHVSATQLPLQGDRYWTMEPVTNLSYEDDVSWLSEERDILPGRDTRMRVETRRHHAHVIANRARQGTHPPAG